MFTYSGWNAASYMAEEIRNPGRNVPLALFLGTVGVIVIYALLNALYLYAIPVNELAGVKGSVFDFIGERMLGQRAGDVLAIVAIISLAAGLNAWTFAGPRIYYAMARDGVFFPGAARVHARFKTPHVSIVAQAAWTSLLILTGSLDTLTNYVGFAIILFAGIAVAAVFVLRARDPQAPRPYKAFGYPFAPGLFVAASMAIVLNAMYRDPGPFGLGLLVIGAGIPLYMWLTRRKVS
jgi:APA family basic amino acid/polyamine antiporter